MCKKEGKRFIGKIIHETSADRSLNINNDGCCFMTRKKMLIM